MPWNRGRFVGPKPPLKPKKVWAIRLHLQREQRLRDLAMFDLAVDSKLRGCDLVRLKIGQLVVNGTARYRATVIQRKTERPVQFELTDQTRESVLAWLELRGGTLDNYVFSSRSRGGQHLSTRQYARLVGEWVETIGLGRSAYGTHSLRRTKVALTYKRSGNLRAVQILLGHTKLESTVRYLGVDAEHASPCPKPRRSDSTGISG
ncbi:tyrosine-type recombinase/integrase [Roseomonas sp. SXEYE002]|nr:tyrosine-type recombinase/integrase [Roseomonas sp. SXEYE001]